MAASTALAASGCSQPPPEKILPYVDMPEGLLPGDPVFYASTLQRGGFPMGVLVETESGRPTKIEGNPAHPASLGAADAQAQAAILTLWDPERSRTVMRGQQLSTWAAMLDALVARVQAEAGDDGRGLRLLTGPVSSPTLLSQIGALLGRFPGARWHVHDPADSGVRSAAALRVFGRPARAFYRLDQARFILSADADLFEAGTDGVRNAAAFMAARRKTPRAAMVALESSPNLCGAQADRRIVLPPAEIEAMLEQLAARLARPAAPSGPASGRIDKLYRLLAAARGASVVAAGPGLSPRAHVLAWHINALLGNLGRTVLALEPAPARPAAAHERGAGMDRGRANPAGLAELAGAMRERHVRTLIMLDTNPAYDAPGALEFAAALERVPYSLHMGLYRDETAHLASWHVPMIHDLEGWSDASTPDGAASIVQPVIAPLYGGRSAHELMSVLTTDESADVHQLVRGTWRARWGARDDAAFEPRWREALMRGVIGDAPAPRTLMPVPGVFDAPGGAAAQDEAAGAAGDKTLIAVLSNDSNLVTGAYANNAWLQELPRPYTKITWDNAALISPATARAYALRSGDMVELSADGAAARVQAPVWVLAGQADGVITLPLGYGRRHAGSTARGHGFDAYVLQDVRDGVELRTRAVTMTPTGGHHEFACTQHDVAVYGRGRLRVQQAAAEKPAASLYPARDYDTYAWGMTVDLDACIGCNACVVACQAENNIPVVGPEQVALGREMQWMRVDLYAEAPGRRTQFQPMACQHCENAPCEVVCPVGATMHDSEGLNVQVYNRCVGTRFCSNNCPYKVRHFNFFQFSDNDPSAAAHANPDVTVRQRGVMEKCTYCVQRISQARIQAQKAGRPIRDGDVVVACQATCPTGAIVFGDTNDPDSRVSRDKAQPRNFEMLGELNTRPRTSYLARNAGPEIDVEDDDG
jgi:molybdopterin-containing oxidoreductase family iron-sulfur binding subunit